MSAQPMNPGAGRPVRVLVVDDNQDSVDTMALLLRMHGHDVRTATDGQDAIDVAGEFAPELVLLDLGLPRLDGYDVARRLRAQPATSHAVLVALTGWGGREVTEKAEQAGFDHHLVKPTQWDHMLRILESVSART